MEADPSSSSARRFIEYRRQSRLCQVQPLAQMDRFDVVMYYLFSGQPLKPLGGLLEKGILYPNILVDRIAYHVGYEN